MKKAILFVCAVLLCTGAAFGGMISEDPGELTVSGQWFFPGLGDTDLFKQGYGAVVSYREWFSFPWGVGVNLGLSRWQVDRASRAFKYDNLTQYDGDALLIPLGASLYFNMIDWDNWNVILGTGFQYAFVDSAVSVYNKEAAVMGREDVDMGGTLLWNIGGEYEYMVAENLYVVGGAGLQMDLVSADTEYAGGSLRDASFAGFYLNLGAKFLF
jgi:hypothetical protein